LAASSWGYRIEEKKSGPAIIWYNSDIEGGDSVVILVQYGHATRTGGYVQGRDFINPAMAPVFDFILQDIERKVNG
jgi:hypothetical protein